MSEYVPYNTACPSCGTRLYVVTDSDEYDHVTCIGCQSESVYQDCIKELSDLGFAVSL